MSKRYHRGFTHQTIVEDTANRLFSVRPSTPPGFPNVHDHLWMGMPVKRLKGGFAPKANACEILVRKAGCTVIQQGDVA